MKIITKTLLLLGLAAVLVAPDLAEARAGGGRSSFGSRGGRTYQAPPIARPVERSTTPRPTQQQQPPYTNAAPQAPVGQSMGFASRHPFLSSIAGGLLGASLANMLFGNSAYGMGGGAGGSGIGLLQILLFGGLIYMGFRWLRNRSSGMNPFQNLGGCGSGMGSRFGAQSEPIIPIPSANERSLSVAQEDKQAFENLLSQIQLAWGEGDMARLRQFITPEMFTYFSEELSANQSRGEINRILDVVFHSCDIVESWSEGSLDFVTVRMRWRAIDFMARLGRQPSDSDFVASGDFRSPVEAQEVWTFVRARSGGQWLLSAIQQVA